MRTGDLIGLPLLDYEDSTIGYMRDVVRTPDGKIFLVFPYGRWLGWLRAGGPFDWNRRLVGVPIEIVAILARQMNALDMSREDIDQLPGFSERRFPVCAARRNHQDRDRPAMTKMFLNFRPLVGTAFSLRIARAGRT